MAAAATWVATHAGTIALASSAISAAAAISSASAQSRQLKIKAAQAELQGRQNALQYSRQASQVLERQQMLAGAARARAASGGIDPFTGSPLTIQQADAMKAGEEYGISQDNAQMAIYGGLAESQSLRSAASTTMATGVLSAIGSAGMGLAAYGATATPKVS